MKEENRIRQPLIIIFSAIVMLYLVSFIKLDYQFIGFQFRTVDIFSDLKTSTDEFVPPPAEDNTTGKMHASPGKTNTASLNPMPVINSLSDFIEKEIAKTGNTVIFIPQDKIEPITGNTAELKSFFDALKNVKKKTVRVAHYGDSIIEGDLVTADIREALQKKFGGNGVGWMGIISQDINFRMTTKHTYSDNWETASLYTNNSKSLPLGISGEIAIPKGNAWVKYETTRYRKSLKDFSIVRLFYSNAKNSKMYYSFDNGPKQAADLKAGSSIQELVFKANGKAKAVKLEFPTADQAYLYGVSIENEPGVYVDNFPLRGNSGVDLNQIPSDMLKSFSRYLDYDLIILQFGLNIEGSRGTDYSWYEREMDKVVKHLKDAYPHASFILFGVHDKAMKRGSEFVTDPGILSLLETQKKIAANNNIAFFSLFNAMGGMNSMPKWVQANPPLAFKDFIHFNDLGAAKLAQLFTESLLTEFDKNK